MEATEPCVVWSTSFSPKLLLGHGLSHPSKVVARVQNPSHWNMCTVVVTGLLTFRGDFVNFTAV